MNHRYHDILERIDEPPLWFDEHAVPRFCPFSPGETANIYANECCLLMIECQGCRALFRVCVSRTRYQTMESAQTLGSLILDDEIHYGDPPNIACCAAGPTMNSVPIRVLEFWKREGATFPNWQRVPELERAIDPAWTHP